MPKEIIKKEKKSPKAKINAVALESKVYNQEGKEVGSVSLPESIFGVPWNADLVHQVVVSMRSNERTPVAHAKDRSEVRGGGKKPWKQKGTGSARHGSRRSPIWVGGGVSHGPNKNKNYERKINKKMAAKAFYTVVSEKLRNGEIIFVDKLQFSSPKTKDAKKVLEKMGSISGFASLPNKRKNALIVATIPKNDLVNKSFQNMGNVKVTEFRNLNPVVLLNYKYLLISEPEKAFEIAVKRMSKTPIQEILAKK